jgi:predicted ATPase
MILEAFRYKGKIFMKLFRSLLSLFCISLLLSFADAPILQHITPTQSPTTQGHRYVITGGPGVGKTSIIRHLKEMGYHVVGEAATDVIQDALNRGIEKPWDKEYKSDFNDAILELQQHRQNEIPDTGLVFFDRSMIDTFTYAIIPMGGTKSLETMASKVQSVIDKQFYHKTVFFIDNLNGCEKNEIRHENLDQLHMIEKHIEQNYLALGYNVIHITKDTVGNRAKQILAHIERVR